MQYPRRTSYATAIFENRGKIIYAPIYMTMFIERKQPMQRQIFRIDMTALK